MVILCPLRPGQRLDCGKLCPLCLCCTASAVLAETPDALPTRAPHSAPEQRSALGCVPALPSRAALGCVARGAVLVALGARRSAARSPPLSAPDRPGTRHPGAHCPPHPISPNFHVFLTSYHGHLFHVERRKVSVGRACVQKGDVGSSEQGRGGRGQGARKGLGRGLEPGGEEAAVVLGRWQLRQGRGARRAGESVIRRGALTGLTR